MKANITRRVAALEASLGKKQSEWAVIWKWGHDSEEVREDKLARWRAGEDIEGAPTHIRDRANASVLMRYFVSPPKRL